MSGPLELTFTLIDDGVDGSFDPVRLDAMCCHVLTNEGQSGPWEVTLALVSDEDLRALHAQFMGDDSVTDVMTFPADDDDSGGGDIVVSVDRAGEQGPEHGFSREQEVDFLFVHGLLHLCGWDDRDDTDRSRMLARQSELLELFHRQTLAP